MQKFEIMLPQLRHHAAAVSSFQNSHHTIVLEVRRDREDVMVQGLVVLLSTHFTPAPYRLSEPQAPEEGGLTSLVLVLWFWFSATTADLPLMQTTKNYPDDKCTA